MNASKFGFVLLATVALATPACFTVDDGDDEDGGEGGESGEGSGGSSGKGGSSGEGGSSGKGGSSSGGSSGATAGGGGSSGGNSSVCSGDGFALSPIECPVGSSSFLDDAICNYYFSCIVASDCASSGSECAACLTANESALAAYLQCYEGGTTGFADACITTSQGEDSVAASPECIISG